MKRKLLKITLVIISLTLLFFTIKYILILNSSDSLNISNRNNEKLFFNKPEKFPSSTYIKVFKENRFLELYGDNKLIGRLKIGLGRSPIGTKHKEGDNKTPEGKYYICTKNDKTKYTYFMGISYPNIEDAKEGLKNNLINKNDYNVIKKAIENKTLPPWNTALGGAVGIHGGGNKYDWTYGCIAVSNEDIKLLWQYCNYGTTIEIFK
ncbi:murein L,D-transpeptidase YafK [Clostridium tetanomorphum]|uniref:L,D-transpeptidase family protein n=1 Tax=Clostridium tetanomorphum TaxID=1553 RepID=UPI000447D8EE|nr:L,D-transpeptidase family protein [Clostridium tetanomorphum]KAJ49796.1 hypothetical protein CTM_21301 [Clostridium tetanomorphum DSM 665]MBP1864687.1 murein L,D-transpeptidase YafK [Clostridium tetanomorphum]NRS84157.1 murein L,D-transpeptidase YafK [Clostridium tetanomorphum]NRZ97370.1 murein L,D-transpeptidase YafK [Clostridium tetanomorphum]SQB92639.1 ErfK/YbiS/YcfS/YnhG family protein [Clostridium tetanomorphum]